MKTPVRRLTMLGLSVAAVMAGPFTAQAVAAPAAPSSAAARPPIDCVDGQMARQNNSAEIAPIYEYPGDGEAFSAIYPNHWLCTDAGLAKGPDGQTYRHATSDSNSPVDGWINVGYVG